MSIPRRNISVEHLIEHIKDVFKIDPLLIRGYYKAAPIVLLSVLIYQTMVCYNCITDNKQPKAIKHMRGRRAENYFKNGDINNSLASRTKTNRIIQS